MCHGVQYSVPDGIVQAGNRFKLNDARDNTTQALHFGVSRSLSIIAVVVKCCTGVTSVVNVDLNAVYKPILFLSPLGRATFGEGTTFGGIATRPICLGQQYGQILSFILCYGAGLWCELCLPEIAEGWREMLTHRDIWSVSCKSYGKRIQYHSTLGIELYF